MTTAVLVDARVGSTDSDVVPDGTCHTYVSVDAENDGVNVPTLFRPSDASEASFERIVMTYVCVTSVSCDTTFTRHTVEPTVTVFVLAEPDVAVR